MPSLVKTYTLLLRLMLACQFNPLALSLSKPCGVNIGTPARRGRAAGGDALPGRLRAKRS
jgi:hypothetical protein